MLHSFLVVAGDDEADELSPGIRWLLGPGCAASAIFTGDRACGETHQRLFVCCCTRCPCSFFTSPKVFGVREGDGEEKKRRKL